MSRANVGNPEPRWDCLLGGRREASTQALAQGAIVRAIRDAKQQFGIDGRLIGAIDREASPAAALEMVEWMAANRCDEAIGIGIDYSIHMTQRSEKQKSGAAYPGLTRSRWSFGCRLRNRM